MKCCVCSTELLGDHTVCPYCGYANPVVLTPSGDDSQQHREKLLSSLRNISIDGKQFQYHTGQKVFREIPGGAVFEKGLSGTDCAGSIVRSKEWIAHMEGTADLHIAYEVNGKKKETSVPVSPGERAGLWYLGLCINQDLRLEVYLDIVEPDSGSLVDQVKLASANMEFNT